jgi:hypothetical protein
LDYPFNNRSDLIVPGSGAAGIFYPPEMTSSFRDNSGQTDYCALRYPDTGTADYQVVFLAFPFEAIPQGGAYPDNANTVMGRILDWFGISKSFTRGDVNKDGEVNVTDVVYLINYLFKNGPEPQPWESGDVNCDNEVSVSDVVYLIFYLFREGPPPC